MCYNIAINWHAVQKRVSRLAKEIKIAVIGLDTSHSIAFTKCFQAPECSAEERVGGARVVSCLRFSTPFQSEEGLNERQAQLEGWGVNVTTDFDESVRDCDAICIEINDPAYHLEYFTKCAKLGLPMFLDKPLTDTSEHAREIMAIAKANNARFFSASSLRHVPELANACEVVPEPRVVTTYGPLGKAPAGSSIVWYGVHAFDMLQRALGPGAKAVFTRSDKVGAVAVVDYDDGRRGVVELSTVVYNYGGCLRSPEHSMAFAVNTSGLYVHQLKDIMGFFNGGDAPVSPDDALEVLDMLDAAERSSVSGKTEAVGNN